MKIVTLLREEFKDETVFDDIIFGCIRDSAPSCLAKDLSKFRKIHRLTLHVRQYKIEYE